MASSVVALAIYWAFKRYIIGVAAQRLNPIPIPASPSYRAGRDVSIIVPTIATGIEFVEALASWLANDPLEIIVVTVENQVTLLNALIDKSLEGTAYSRVTVAVLALSAAGKRKQMARGLDHAKGSIIVFVDDDVFWQPLLLRYVLACFEDEKVGGVGTRQRVRSSDGEFKETASTWQRLADRRLVRRNRSQAALNYLDGGITCLSGRTAAYRSEILKSPKFIQSFTRDFWLGTYLLDSGDDTFCTRWLIAKGWRFKLQTAPEAEIYTVAIDSSLFLR